ncbi:hypothetical protein C922_05578 [Plasmodium inui San Antonio 1]|uniref:Uncharacterized protein n=1 Tax=Plasmodium inui San Antonio 1 TaxID=1237626 RepID=W6ZT23_9APIC|nr:hypothetical protein C922_05578 [Plasmodium inui San Antonio 1]EUD64042.1 hypothetical protein C922_05578 [Plasmodium inui San Antonio 1]
MKGSDKKEQNRSDVTREQRTDPEGEHHSNAGRRSIMMKKLHGGNSDRNLANKGIYIKVPGEVESSEGCCEESHHKQTFQKFFVRGRQQTAIFS